MWPEKVEIWSDQVGEARGGHALRQEDQGHRLGAADQGCAGQDYKFEFGKKVVRFSDCPRLFSVTKKRDFSRKFASRFTFFQRPETVNS